MSNKGERGRRRAGGIGRRLLVVAATAALLGLQGCAAVGLTLFGVGAGVGAGNGVSYTLDSIAYKTFTTPLDDLHRATLRSLRRMDMQVKEDKVTESGRHLVTLAGDRTIDIELERLTARTSRIRVNAKENLIFKDRATATEIIVQTERALESQPVLSRTTKFNMRTEQ